MPARHLITAIFAVAINAASVAGVELTLTDANVAFDEITVSNVGSSVTVTDSTTGLSQAPQRRLPAEQRVVAYPDLTGQGKRSTKPITHETIAHETVSETATLPEIPASFSEPGIVGSGVVHATGPLQEHQYQLCQCATAADCSCEAGGFDSGAVFVDDGGAACGCGDICGGGCGAGSCTAQKGLVLDFWISQGFTWNPDDPTNGFNDPVTFNDRANEYQLNQIYLALGREVDTGCGWDIGGRVDLLYGTDYFFTQATGLEVENDGTPHWNSNDGPRRLAGQTAAMYGLAMPQAYLELFAPIGPGIKFKLGHFYTAIGYESVMAPENFFYSHAYTMQYAEPFTHTGMLAEFSLSRRMDVLAGFTRGWDNWEDPNGDLGFLGGFSWTAPSEMASLALTVHSSSEDANGLNNRTIYSLVYTRQLGSRLRYIMQHDFGMEELAELNQAGVSEAAKWYGINNYLIYQASNRLSFGLRAEWFRDQDNARVLALPIESLVEGGNYFGLTAGANWNVNSRWTMRPEIRWDHSDVEVPSLGRTGMYNNFTENDQLTLATDLIFRF